VLAVVAAGGALGSAARYGVAVAWPHRPGGFAWSTFCCNAVGCLLIGVLLVAATEVWLAHRLIRPFLGVGVLGGFTTFSTYVVDTAALVRAGRPAVAAGYLLGTVVTALVGVQAGVVLTRLAAGRGRAG